MNFNKVQKTTPNAYTYEGGLGYTKNPIEDWLNFLFSSMNEDRYYESAKIQEQRYLNIMQKVADKYGYEFIAKAAMFARNELGMRSISQLTAAWLANKSFVDKRAFYRNYCHRPDDVSEVFAATEHLNIPRNHSMCRGFGDYLSTLDGYSLGKYKMKRRQYNMYDIINLTHSHSDFIQSFLDDELDSPDTWEVNIATAKNVEERQSNWREMVEKSKLGYLALIRNLNNILDACQDVNWLKRYLVSQITNRNSIHRSLVFPYQIYVAYKNLKYKNTVVVQALEDAFRTSVENMPKLEGNSVVILDVSGSMDSRISAHSSVTLKEAGAVYGIAITLQNLNTKLIKFGTSAKSFIFIPINNLFDEIKKYCSNDNCGFGTRVETAYNKLHTYYNRIFLISDMQIMSPWYEGMSCYKDYCNKYGISTIYSFDLANYSTQTDNPNNPHVHLCTSLSEKVFKFIALLEQGINIVDYINNNYFYC